MNTASKPALKLAGFRQHSILGLAVLAALLSVLYWCVVASDRYISEAHAIIQSTDINSGQTMDLSSLLGNANTSNRNDQMLLRDYLMSVDMLKKLDAELDLRSHYSDNSHDLLSRMWFKDASLEKFYKYYLNRVSVEYDEYAGVLIIKAQAYDAKMAHAITSALVSEGEQFMNALAQQLAQEQVNFLNQQLAHIKDDTMAARQAMLSFQNKHGMVSPEATTENVAGIVNSLQAKLTDLQTTRAAMLGYLMPNSANINELNLQIAAVEKQIASENARLVSATGKTLNRTVEEYQRLKMNAEFTQDIYKSALIALQKGRFEASRTLKKMSLLQAPTYPEYPLEPRRIYSSLVSLLIILLATGILQLLAAIIRDHKD